MTDKEYAKLLEDIYQRFPSFQTVGGRAYKPGLANMLALEEALGHPSKDFKAVHVAGTNGKGSVSHMIAAALMQLPKSFVEGGSFQTDYRSQASSGSGTSHYGTSIKGSGHLRVGLYTSPHLVDFRERIKVDGRMVEKEWVFNFLKDNKELFERTGASFFEITTAMAFSYFSYRKVDVAVVECGLGGRLDSTNIITPICSIITNIGFDHMQYLGNTLEEIASEKAGIIKPAVPVIIGETSGVERVFINKASACSTDIYFAEKLNPYNLFTDGVYRSFSHRSRDEREEALKSVVSLATCFLAGVDMNQMDLKGNCQKKNIKTVCMALSVILRKLLDSSRQDLSERSIAEMVEAIENAARLTGLRGRWEKLSDNPLVICDIGHNSHGMKVLMPQVEHTFAQRCAGYVGKKPRLIMLFGVMKDKDLSAEAGFLPRNAHYLYVNASTPRALAAADLKERMDECGFEGEIPSGSPQKEGKLPSSSIAEALEWIKKNAEAQDFVFIGGSSYVVAEVLAQDNFFQKGLHF